MRNLQQYRPVRGCPTYGAARRVVAVVLAFLCGCAAVIAFLVHHLNQQTAEGEAATLRLDWSEWHGPALDITAGDGAEEANTPASATSRFVGGDLRSLVYNCSMGMEVEGVSCGDDAVERGDDFRIPHFSGHTPSCGFEVRTHRGVCVVCCPPRARTVRASTAW